MNRFFASLHKEMLLMMRDRVGLLFTFLLPVSMVLISTTVQNGAFEMMGRKTIEVSVSDLDQSKTSRLLVEKLNAQFKIMLDSSRKETGALVFLSIPNGFEKQISRDAGELQQEVLKDFNMEAASGDTSTVAPDSIRIRFSPLADQTIRKSFAGILAGITGGLAQQTFIRNMYSAVSEKKLSEKDEAKFSSPPIRIAIQENQNEITLNATQHNIPAWTVFGIFFIVISLAGNLVSEKLSGTFLRLQLLPGATFRVFLAKQIIYLEVVILQVMIIFSLGIWLFPFLSLPALVMPENLFTLFLAVAACGITSVSFSFLIGIIASTREQSNGLGAALVVIFSALGGIFVPAFAMPPALELVMHASPLYYAMRALQGTLLENWTIAETIYKLIPLLCFTFAFQTIGLLYLKRKILT